MQYLFVIVFFNFFIAAFSIVCYVFRSLGVMGMMKQFGMDRPGMAFIPFYGDYLFGKVAEESSLRINGKKPMPFGKILLFGRVACGVFTLILPLIWFVLGMSAGASSEAGGKTMIIIIIFVCVVIMWAMTLVVNLISIALAVFEYIALYKVYKCFTPNNAVLFTVLSIVVSVTMPFLLFSVRNKEPLSPVIDGFEPESADPR